MEIIKFQQGLTTDHKGRTINQIWELSHFWLEHDHEYIQWLFPLDTQTKFNKHAPVLTHKTCEAFAESTEALSAQRQSLKIMLKFFGMEWVGEDIKPSKQLNIKDHIWLKHGGHNHLRISRIIRSLSLCGQHQLSVKFQEAMLAAAHEYGEVNETSHMYWINANQ